MAVVGERFEIRPLLAALSAAEGRVAVLFLSENAGAGGQTDDPLNLAALETVLHGGWAFRLNPVEMPAKDSAAALLRF